MQALKDEIMGVEKSEEDRKKKLQVLERDIEDLQEEIAHIPSPEETAEQLVRNCQWDGDGDGDGIIITGYHSLTRHVFTRKL